MGNKADYRCRYKGCTITFRECALDYYMGLNTNNPMGTPTTVAEVKRQLTNEF